jgi:hypothetical protein
MLIIIPPTPDLLEIRDAPNQGGNVVITITISVGETRELYATAYNDTAGYIGEIVAFWEIDDTNTGSIDAQGHLTNFTGLKVQADSTCTITATYEGLTNSTGLLLVLAPSVDEIRIRDMPNGEGTEITTATYNAEEIDTFYAAAYNNTIGYLYDISGAWSCDLSSIGQIESSGIQATFTAQILAATSTCTVTVQYNGISNSTGFLTVNAVPGIIPPARPNRPKLEVAGHQIPNQI